MSSTDICGKTVSAWWKSEHKVSETGVELAYSKSSKETIVTLERTGLELLSE